jgi:DNA (cytosine-5)-methyltransferase 1
MSAGLDAVDLFAGPGGWDVAAEMLGLDVLGIEWDDAACATRKAAGHATVQADVATLNPAHYLAPGQIGSPPCQGFSMAGSGKGRDDSVALLVALESVVDLDSLLRAMDALRPVMTDEKTLLALEPLRWALTTLPEWISWEQVPAVLPIWQASARILGLHGYSVDTGNVQAEQHGVPQTRKRALLVGRSAALTVKIGPARLPVPTHSRYHSRTPGKLDAGVLKWVSMAEALEWDEPRVVVGNYGTGGDPAKRGERSSDTPSSTVTSKTDRVKWWPLVRPSPTIVGTRRSGDGVLVGRQLGAGASRQGVGGHSGDRGLQPGQLEGVRITHQEAAVLQTFPRDYPWQGVRTKVGEQIGNAIPPLLALHTLCAANGLELPR